MHMAIQGTYGRYSMNAKYNNWDEYVISLLDEENKDLLGGIFQSERAMSPRLLTSNTVWVTVRRISFATKMTLTYESRTLNGKIIGAYEMLEKCQRLRNFLQIINLQCGIRTYSLQRNRRDEKSLPGTGRIPSGQRSQLSRNFGTVYIVTMREMMIYWTVLGLEKNQFGP